MLDKKEVQMDKVVVMARALGVEKMERQMSILQDKITTEIMSVKEKNLVEEIQVDQAVNLKFQKHLLFLLALLHPQTQLLTVNVGERDAAMEVCACQVPHCLVTKLSLLAQKPQLVPRKEGAFVTLMEGFVPRATCASTSQLALIVQLLLPYAPPCH